MSIVALRYGFAADRTLMQMTFIEKKICDMTIVPESFHPFGYEMAFPDKSPYTVLFCFSGSFVEM